jgi:hypothetical protein
MGTPRTQSGWVIEKPETPHGNLEIITGCFTDAVSGGLSSHGLRHDWRDNHSDTLPDWIRAESAITADHFPGPFSGAALLMTNYGNLEALATQDDGKIGHVYLLGVLGWHGPNFLPGHVGAGPPAFIQGRFGRSGNFEVIVPRIGGGLAHFFRDNDSGNVWSEAAPPSTTGNWSGVGLIHSSFGNLEIVGVRDGLLVFLWQNGAGGSWSSPFTIDRDVRGRPAFIQSSYGGANGNFEVVAARANGGLSHYWRDNSSPNFPWSHAVSFNEMVDSPATFVDVTMIQSSFGRLDVWARHDRSSLISHFRASWAAPWEQPEVPWAFPC